MAVYLIQWLAEYLFEIAVFEVEASFELDASAIKA